MGGLNVTAQALRAKTFAELEALGFRPARSLPPGLGRDRL